MKKRNLLTIVLLVLLVLRLWSVIGAQSLTSNEKIIFIILNTASLTGLLIKPRWGAILVMAYMIVHAIFAVTYGGGPMLVIALMWDVVIFLLGFFKFKSSK